MVHLPPMDEGRGFTPRYILVTVDLAAGTSFGIDGTDTLSGIENVLGCSAADSILGDGQANWLDGSAGSDTLGGGLGDDTLDGGTDSDWVTYTRASGAGQSDAAGSAGS